MAFLIRSKNYHKIGQIVHYAGKDFIVEKDNKRTCDDCGFDGYNPCSHVACCDDDRADETNVIFKEVIKQ